MSKKSNKTNQVRKPVNTAARSAAKPSGKPVAGRPVNGKPVVAKGHTHSRAAEPAVNLQAVRIVAAVVAFVCLAGAVAAITMGAVKADPASIIEMVLLGVIVAFGIFTVVKPEMVTGWVSRLGK